MKLQMTKADIQKANKLRREAGDDFNFNHSCPIAQTVRREKRKSVDVSDDFVVIAKGTYLLDDGAQEFISKWDTGREVKPIKIELKLMKESENS